MIRFFHWFNNLYPVWLVSLAIVAFFKPQTMLWFDKPWILWSLAASMLDVSGVLSASTISPASDVTAAAKTIIPLGTFAVTC